MMSSERQTGRTTRTAQLAVNAAVEGQRVYYVMPLGGHEYLCKILEDLGARRTGRRRFAIADGTIDVVVARDPNLARNRAGTENAKVLFDHAV